VLTGLLARIFRFDRPPVEALAVLDRDERVTAWATAVHGEVIVATQHGLWLGSADHGGRRRVAWHDIHKATWGGGALTLVPGREVEAGVVADEPPIRIALDEPRDLPFEVRARVTRSVAYSSHHALPGGGVWIVARRVSGVDGLTWVLRFDDGTDRTDPEVRQRAAEMLDQTRVATDTPH
jgi:hypothetical protein